MFLLRIVILVMGIVRVELAFTHEVKPTCLKSSEECTIDLRINYIMSMVYYNWTTDDGMPVFSRNGTFYKKTAPRVGSVNHYCEVNPLQESELEEVLTVDGSYKFMYAFNNQFPGPTLVVYENQIVKVRVYNDLVNEAVTIHWHGLFQDGNPWMDGVSMLSQCPILPGQMFTYKFKASPSGTHWYHSHHGAMRREGLSGAFIVLPRQERTDIPKVDEDMLFLTQDWLPSESDVEVVTKQKWYMLQFLNNLNTATCSSTKLTYDGSLSTLARPYNNALINGKSKSFSEDSTENQRAVPMETFHVNQNSSSRFRIINTGSTGEYKISIDEHKILLIGTDGADLSPLLIDFLFINPGETFDVILVSNNTPGNYWIRVETTEVMDLNFNRIQPNVSFGQLHYKEAELDLPDSVARKCTKSEPCVMANCQWGEVTMAMRQPYSTCLSIADLQSLSPSQPDNSDSPIVLPESQNDFQEFFFNFHFTGYDVIRERPAVNTIHYTNPPVPLQMYPDTVQNKTIVCNNENMEQCVEYCKCTHVVKLASNKVTQLVLTSEDSLNVGPSHPIHLHGNRFYVVKYGIGEINETTGITQGLNPDIEYSSDFRSAKWRNSSWNNGNVPDINTKDPPLKDTVLIPFRGYVVIRFITDKIGFWLLHCHLESHMNIGMAVALQVGEEHEQPEYPKDIPRCFNYDPDSRPTPAHDSNDDVGDKTFLQMPGFEGKSTIGSINSRNVDGPSDMDGMSTSQIVMITFLVAFFSAVMVFSVMLLVKYYRSRRGYHRIDKDRLVIFRK
ncbi:uncharacterized protein LOC111114966 [Crassostrea virginica]